MKLVFPKITFFLCLVFSSLCTYTSEDRPLALTISENVQEQIGHYVNIHEPAYLNLFLNNICNFVQHGSDPRISHLLAILEQLKTPIKDMIKHELQFEDWALCTRNYESVMWFENKRLASIAYLQTLQNSFWYHKYTTRLKTYGKAAGLVLLGAILSKIVTAK